MVDLIKRTFPYMEKYQCGYNDAITLALEKDKQRRGEIAELEEKLHWKVVSHIAADERIEELEQDMWAARYCNPTKDLRLCKDRIKELRTKKNFFRDKMTNKIGEIEKLQARVEKLEGEIDFLKNNWINPTGDEA